MDRQCQISHLGIRPEEKLPTDCSVFCQGCREFPEIRNIHRRDHQSVGPIVRHCASRLGKSDEQESELTRKAFPGLQQSSHPTICIQPVHPSCRDGLHLLPPNQFRPLYPLLLVRVRTPQSHPTHRRPCRRHGIPPLPLHELCPSPPCDGGCRRGERGVGIPRGRNGGGEWRPGQGCTSTWSGTVHWTECFPNNPRLRAESYWRSDKRRD
uniref:Uncharacterized protein n=1 Tax=Cacopsylla melanoneura TaxID=428564 RepID=A0A8D8TS26_9HEMI